MESKQVIRTSKQCGLPLAVTPQSCFRIVGACRDDAHVLHVERKTIHT